MTLILQVRTAAGSEQIELPPGVWTIGREDDCDVRVDDPGVSCRHARLRNEGNRWIVEDLDSRHGTTLNGSRIQSAELTDGDRIGMGPDAYIEISFDARESAVARDPGAESSAHVRSDQRARRAAGGHEKRSHSTGVLEPLLALLGYGPHHKLRPLEQGRPTHALDAHVTHVGSGSEAELRIDDPSVSALHARIDVWGRRVGVSVQKRGHVLRVDGAPVLEADLAPGQIVEFGRVSYALETEDRWDPGRLAIVLGSAALISLSILMVRPISEWLWERQRIDLARRETRLQAIRSIEQAAAVLQNGQNDIGRAYLTHAAELLAFLSPSDDETQRRSTQDWIEHLRRDFPPALREVTFSAAFDSVALQRTQEDVQTLGDAEYIDRMTRVFASELGQDQDVPTGFIEAVRTEVWRIQQWPHGFRERIQRARTIHPLIRPIILESRLNESFIYVAWEESQLNPLATSGPGARGLWQIMPATARELGLQVDHTVDERIDPVLSTRAATKYLANMMRQFGPENAMCVLASYNKGPNGIMRRLLDIPDPMMKSGHKYWYLVEHDEVPPETKNYVPRIFAARIVAEAPERFGVSAQ